MLASPFGERRDSEAKPSGVSREPSGDACIPIWRTPRQRGEAERCEQRAERGCLHPHLANAATAGKGRALKGESLWKSQEVSEK